MAVDMFIDIDKIPGESKDADAAFKGKIDVLAWSWGLSQSGSFQMGGGGGSGKVNVSDISFSKWVDISTPVLMLACANGDHIPKAVLTVRKAGKKPLNYIQITMEKIIVSSISTGGSGGEDRLTESVSLNFAKASFKYIQQSDTGGEDTKKEFKWDIEANTGDVS
jgi:type VI secretion system secreted protein Hcp